MPCSLLWRSCDSCASYFLWSKMLRVKNGATKWMTFFRTETAADDLSGSWRQWRPTGGGDRDDTPLETVNEPTFERMRWKCHPETCKQSFRRCNNYNKGTLRPICRHLNVQTKFFSAGGENSNIELLYVCICMHIYIYIYIYAHSHRPLYSRHF